MPSASEDSGASDARHKGAGREPRQAASKASLFMRKTIFTKGKVKLLRFKNTISLGSTAVSRSKTKLRRGQTAFACISLPRLSRGTMRPTVSSGPQRGLQTPTAASVHSRWTGEVCGPTGAHVAPFNEGFMLGTGAGAMAAAAGTLSILVPSQHSPRRPVTPSQAAAVHARALQIPPLLSEHAMSHWTLIL
ncbi:hypothetical protein P4O66_000700 [Electrophorus voltai]|uniref:Uncharacterized protein n=1 Tax=Electrophorus voltai TaxID=2609070 RepID=A0AAD8ZF22_9TELE|nr:hypothetical protein P4O66_000700 [Electrophorus voltai]